MSNTLDSFINVEKIGIFSKYHAICLHKNPHISKPCCNLKPKWLTVAETNGKINVKFNVQMTRR